jgi:hypothetical protein
LEGQVTQGPGGPTAPPDLSKSGYRLVGGQVVATGEGPACRLVYDDPQGTRITLLMVPVQKRDTSATQFAEAGGGNGGGAPQLAEAGGGNGGGVPQLAEAGGGNGGRVPQFAEAGGDSGGQAPRLAEAGSGKGASAPQLAEAGSGNGGGTTTLAAAGRCP